MNPSIRDGLSTEARPGVSIKLDGPRVGPGQLAVRTLAQIVLCLQRALNRVGGLICLGNVAQCGRIPKFIKQRCELSLVAWSWGSAVLRLELLESGSPNAPLPDLCERSLGVLFGGLERIDRQSCEGHAELPEGWDIQVVQIWASLGKVLDQGVDTLWFYPCQGPLFPAIRFDSRSRAKVRRVLRLVAGSQPIEKVGRLEVLEGHHGLSGYLWEADGTRWRCHFQPEHREIVRRAWLQRVKLTGEVVHPPAREPFIQVSRLDLLDEPTQDRPAVEAAELSSFWKPVSLEQMAKLQGVQPAEDLDAIAALWPMDEDPDQLLSYILQQRMLRRASRDEERSG